jgi:hypothetical protein
MPDKTARFRDGSEDMGEILRLRPRQRSGRNKHCEDVPVEPGRRAGNRCPWFDTQ